MTDPRIVLCVACALISTIVAVQFVAALRRIWWKSAPESPGLRRARLSVIVPARDEAKDLHAALQSIREQQGVDLEIIVVNDHSCDQTGIIADSVARSEPRLTVIHDPELPPGWLGKCNAMQQASQRATADLLLFTDADIVHAPGCFSAAITELDRRELDFLSLFPLMDFVSLWENVLLPALMGGLSLLATPGIEDSRSPDALAAGAFLLIRTRAFRAIGGFESIRNEMFDDVALAARVKREGFRVGFRAAPHLLRVRLFKDNRHAFWGMTKNILEGLRGRFWLAPLVMLLPAFVFWTPLYCAVAGVLEGNATLAVVGAATYLLQYATFWCARGLLRFHPAKVLFFPLIAIPIFCCMARAWYLYVCRGAVQWRGRTIRVRPSQSSS